MFAHWNLWFGIYLKFGAWNLLFLSEPLALRAGGRLVRVRYNQRAIYLQKPDCPSIYSIADGLLSLFTLLFLPRGFFTSFCLYPYLWISWISFFLFSWPFPFWPSPLPSSFLPFFWPCVSPFCFPIRLILRGPAYHRSLTFT